MFRKNKRQEAATKGVKAVPGINYQRESAHLAGSRGGRIGR